MKVYLITIKSSINFGAVLQAYATNEYLKKLGCNVEFIDYHPKYNKVDSIVLKLKKLIIRVLTIGRRQKINKFYREYFKFTSTKYESIDELENHEPKSDIYIVGSDQVWNSQLSGGELDPVFFLSFVECTKKISYASSIGRTDITKNDLQSMKKYLDDFNHISVRETSAKLMLESVGLKEVEHVLDPVFLLQQEDYKKFIKPIKKEKYLVIYSFDKNPLIEKLALDISKKLNLQIIEIGTHVSRYSCNEFMQNISVEDFLSLIYYADFVITSSFHGTAFSILLNKQFISVAPSVRRTRLDSIVNLFEIEDRLITEKDDYVLDDIVKLTDYEKVNKLVDINSEKSREFLKNAINCSEIPKNI